MVIQSPRELLYTRHWLTVAISMLVTLPGSAATDVTNEQVLAVGSKQVIGATATVAEVKTDLLFKARVDTGATTSSLHVEDYVIEDEAEEMVDNVGRKIRFRMKNHDGESEWIESKIAKVSIVKTSVDSEERYKVHLTLRVHEVQKRVLVTLNDRSHMKYPMLLGRNFLKGDFIVDVDNKKNRAVKIKNAAGAKASSDQQKKTVPAESKSP